MSSPTKLTLTDHQLKFVPTKGFKTFVRNQLNADDDIKDMPPNIHTLYTRLCQNKKSVHIQGIETIPSDNFSKAEIKLLSEINKTFETVDELSDYKLALDKLTQSEPESDSEEEIKRVAKEVRLTVVDLKWLNHILSEKRKNNPDFNVYLHELIEALKIELPKNPVQERNPELEERCVKLRQEQDAYQYHKMTKNIDNSRKRLPEDTIAFQVKQINRQLIAVAQFIFSVAAGFAFGFIGVELIIGNLDFGFRLLLGIICALTIALAEIYFLAKKLNEEDYIIEETKNIVRDKPMSNGKKFKFD